MRAALLLAASLTPALAAAAPASRPAIPFVADPDTLSILAVRLNPPSVDELLGELAGADRRRQMELLDELAQRAGAADAGGQHRLAWALRDLADSQQAAPEVRAHALFALGRGERAMTDPAAQREALETLETEALRDDMNRLPLQPYALQGLAEAAQRLPHGDDAAAQGVAETALEVLRRQRPALERTTAVRVLAVELSAVSVQPLWQKLSGRFDDELLRPAEAGGAYYDPSVNPAEARYYRLACLERIAWGAWDANARERIKDIFRRMSADEPEPRLKILARAYAERLHG